jgi:transposase
MERKVKYDYAFKEECVKLVLENHHSYGFVSTLKGAEKSNIRRWVGFYKQYGTNGLIPRVNQSYTVDFKLKVLQSIDEDFLSLNDTCLKFNIPTSSVFLKWKRDFANFGLEGLQPKQKSKVKFMDNIKRKKHKSDKPLNREEELLVENEALRCELDYLKKLQALIQAEEKVKKLKP